MNLFYVQKGKRARKSSDEDAEDDEGVKRCI